MRGHYETTNKWEVYEAGLVETEDSYRVNIQDTELEVGDYVGTLCIPEDLEGEDFDNYVMEHLIDNTYMLVDEARGHIYVEGEDGVVVVREIETYNPLYVLFQQRIYKRIYKKNTKQTELNHKVYNALGDIAFETGCTKDELDIAIASFNRKFYEEV
jgi:hypothetical protein